ncbi:MFS transporter [Amycolatopsis sp. NPDC102389]|uniref:MFS transporter n=1 Tax=Amycolatopsis sp. NPDC102389 TaxID=3363941 RepID=UPI003815755F
MPPKQAWVLGLASLASFMMALDSQVVTTALGTVRRDLSASIEQLEWIVNAYNLSFAVLLLTGAALGDRFGRRRMFVTGLTVFTVASVACAVSGDIGTLIVARAVQGAGAAMVLPLSLTLISAIFPPERRGKAMGLYLGLTGLATFSGPFIGGVIAEGLAWQWIFWLNLPVGVAAVLLTLRRVDESTGPGNRFHQGGGERRSEAPMLPMRFFRLRAFSTANAANFCVFASLYGTLFFLPQYFQTAQGLGPFEAGLRMMPWTATLMICAPLAGITSAMPAAQRSAVGAVRPSEIGQASGAFMTLRIFGGVFGVAVVVAVFAGAGSHLSPEEFGSGFTAAMATVVAFAFTGMLVALGMPSVLSSTDRGGNR